MKTIKSHASLRVGAALVALALLPLTACSVADGSDADGAVVYAVETFGNDALDPAMETNDPMLAARLMMWDTLLEIAPDGGLAPGIADEWKIADDGLSWRFKIREGVEFHNGEALTGEDVKFSLERMLNPKATYSQIGQARAQIDHVELVDEYTVDVFTKGVQVTFPYLVSSHRSLVGVVYPKDYLLKEGGETFEEQRALLEKAPVGSGPFRFVERTIGQSMLFEAVDKHWRATPEIHSVEVVLAPEESTRISMLQSGEVDIIGVVPDKAASLESSGYEVRTIKGAAELAIYLPGLWLSGMEQKPVGDVRVREALSLAIDREAIIASLLDGHGKLKTTPYVTSQVTQDIDEAAFADWAAEANAYDPERARELLAEAGYPNGFDGIKLFTFPLAGTPNLSQLADIVAAQWAEIGVTAKIVPTDYATFRPYLFHSSKDNAFNLGDANTYGNPPRPDSIGALRAYVAYEGGNFKLLKDPDFDALLTRAEQTIDDNERRDLVTQAWQAFNKEWTVLPVAAGDVTYVVNPDRVGEWRSIPNYPFLARAMETIKLP